MNAHVKKITNQDLVAGPRLSPHAVERFSVLRRVLGGMLRDAHPPEYLRSRQMAELCSCEASQVRRDLMLVGAAGRPGYGYPVRELAERVDELFRPVTKHRAALVGVGTLGRAVISYLQQQYHHIAVVAMFDADREKTGRVLHGIRSYPVDQFRMVTQALGVSVAILAVPENEAQSVADLIVASGILGILCFGPQFVNVPATVHVEHVDITAALDRLGFYVAERSVS